MEELMEHVRELHAMGARRVRIGEGLLEVEFGPAPEVLPFLPADPVEGPESEAAAKQYAARLRREQELDLFGSA